MKKKRILILFLTVLGFVSCTNVSSSKEKNDLTPQEFVDKKIIKNHVIIDGHDYIFYEHGERGYENYSFQLEHSVECQKCYDIFD